MSERKEVYKDYLQGEASEDEVREVFGDEFEEIDERRKLVTMMKKTPNREPSDDLFE